MSLEQKKALQNTLIRFYDIGLVAYPTLIGVVDKFTEKAPFGRKWVGEKATGWAKVGKEDAINAPFEYPQLNAVGLATGAKSSNLYCIDFDVKHDDRKDCFVVFKDKVSADMPILWSKLYVETTISGGFHILYKVAEGVDLGGNIKLAGRDLNEAEKAENKAAALYFLETRGNGGFVVTYPTKGYEAVQGDIYALPVISEEEHTFLLDTAKSQHRASAVIFEKKKVDFEAKEAAKAANSDKWAVMPIDDYNAKTDILELLKAYSWSEGKGGNANETRVKRPGAGSDSSGFVSAKDNVLVCFSLNAGVEVRGGAARVSPFSFLCQMEFGGDFKAAIKHIIEKGFGKHNEAYQVAIGKSKVNGSDRMFVDIPDFEGLKSCATICFVPKGFDLDFCELNMGKVVIGENFEDVAYTLKHRLKGVDFCFLVEKGKHVHYDYENHTAAFLKVGAVPIFLEYERADIQQNTDFETGDCSTNWEAMIKVDKMRVVDFWKDKIAVEKLAALIAFFPEPDTAELWIRDSITEKKEKDKLLTNVRAAVVQKERNAELLVNNRGIKEDHIGTHGLKKELDGKFYYSPLFDGHLNFAYFLEPKTDSDKGLWVLHYHCLKDVEDIYFTLPTTGLKVKAITEALWEKGKEVYNFKEEHLKNLINSKIKRRAIAETVDFVGLDSKNLFWAYSNGLYCPYKKKFEPVNEVGIVSIEHPKTGEMRHYYLPHSKKNTSSILAKFKWSPSNVTWKEISRFYKKSWGDLGVLQMLFVMASAFKDIIGNTISASSPCFPIFFVEGAKGDGKTTLLDLSRLFFYSQDKSVKVSLRADASAPSLNKLMKDLRLPVTLDDYTIGQNLDAVNGLLLAMFNLGTGRLKMGGANFTDLADTEIFSTASVSSNIPPTQSEGDNSNALLDRITYFKSKKREKNVDSKKEFDDKLRIFTEKGFGSAFCELLNLRPKMEKEFGKAYFSALKLLTDYVNAANLDGITPRQTELWAVYIAVFDVCMREEKGEGLLFDITKKDVIDMTKDAMCAQYERLYMEYDSVYEFFQILATNMTKRDSPLERHQDYEIKHDSHFQQDCLFFKFSTIYKAYQDMKKNCGEKQRILLEALKDSSRNPAYNSASVGLTGNSCFSYRKSEWLGLQNTSVFVFPMGDLEKAFDFKVNL